MIMQAVKHGTGKWSAEMVSVDRGGQRDLGQDEGEKTARQKKARTTPFRFHERRFGPRWGNQ